MRRRIHRRCAPALAVLCAPLVAGCETPTQQATAEGAGIGATIGYVGCRLLKGTESQCVLAAAAVGAGGAVIAHNYAKDAEARRAELRGHENDLNARLAYLQGVNRDSAKFNDQLRQELASQSAAIDQLGRQVAAGQAGDPQRSAARAKLQREVTDLNSQVATMDSQLADMKRFRAGAGGNPDQAGVARLDQQIAQLEHTLAESRSNTASLASLGQRI
jgi:hypothetical protein